MTTLQVATAPLDSTCKAILRNLKQLGMDKANVPYETNPSVVSSADFGYLLKRAGLSNGNSFVNVLKNFAIVQSGPQAGNISFELNFDLA